MTARRDQWERSSYKALLEAGHPSAKDVRTQLMHLRQTRPPSPSNPDLPEHCSIWYSRKDGWRLQDDA
jgi:hypothetical protein